MKLEKLAIVGLGSAGRRHLRLVRELRPDVKITVVRSGNRQIRFPEDKLAQCTVQSIEGAIRNGVQAAIIASPSTFHIRHSTQFAKAGVHLMVEKPLSHDNQGLNQFKELVNRNNLKILVGYVLRYDPAGRHFAGILNSGKIGKKLHVRIECGSYLPDWRPERNYKETVSARKELGGGVLLELSHEVDYARWFFGPFVRIQAFLSNSGSLGIDVEECAELLLETKEGLPVQIHLDFHRRHPQRTCTLRTSEGQLCWNILSKEVHWKPVNGEPKADSFEFDLDSLYLGQLQHFLDYLEGHISPVVSLQDGIAALGLVDAARQSHHIARVIDL